MVQANPPLYAPCSRHYSAQGLRLIEIERDDLSDLPKIQKLIAERPENLLFIVMTWF